MRFGMKLEYFVSGKFKQQLKYKSFCPCKINREFVWDNADINILLERANAELSELNISAKFALNINLFISMYASKEAVSSTRIEGTRTKIDELLNDKYSDETRDDKKEVQNYLKALDYAVSRLNELPLSNRLLRETHKILMSGVRGENKYPGEFRKTQNWIGGSNLTDAFYIPPHQSEVEDLMDDWELFMHNESLRIPHLIKIALVHYQFETIHPFCDGNGRLGRLLIILYLINFRLLDKPILYISYFFDKHRTTYYDYLTNARKNNDIIRWILFFLNGIIETSGQAKNVLNKINMLKQNTDDIIKNNSERNSKNVSKIMDYLFKKPIVNIGEISGNLNLNKKTAHNIINKLKDLNILQEITGKQRDKVYSFGEYLKLFEEKTDF
jgi:Fic family protein